VEESALVEGAAAPPRSSDPPADEPAGGRGRRDLRPRDDRERFTLASVFLLDAHNKTIRQGGHDGSRLDELLAVAGST